MTGILLVNMGGPTSEKEVLFFLKKMFSDPYILPFAKPVRFLLSRMISYRRYKKSWQKYVEIGGTPLIDDVKENAKLFNKALGNKYIVDVAFSYSQPLIQETIEKFAEQGIKKIKVIPMYPQESLTTTGSVKADIDKVIQKFPSLEIKVIKQFFDNNNFVDFWTELIKSHIKKQKCEDPLLIFSAHSIPKYLVDKGDSYPQTVNKSAELISQKLKLDYKVTYQSKMGKVEWIGPDTKEVIEGLASETNKDIVVIPISFVNENLETLYDLDTELIPYTKEKLNYKNISRVNINANHPLLIKTFVDIIE